MRPLIVAALLCGFFYAPALADEPPKLGDEVQVASFCWGIEAAQEMVAYAAAGDDASGEKRAAQALKDGECIVTRLPFPATIIAVSRPEFTPEGKAIYVVVARPNGSTVVVFGTRTVEPEDET